MNRTKWMERAKELGLEGLEIRQTTSTSREISWYEGKMDTFVTSKILSTALRAQWNGRLATTSLEKVDDSMMDDVLNGLKTSASLVADSEKDHLVAPQETELTASTRTWTKASVEQIKTTLADLEQRLLAADKRVRSVDSLEWSDGSVSVSQVNSLGLDITDEDTSQALVASITAVENGEVRDGYEIAVVDDLNNFEPDKLVDKLVKKVTDTLGARSMKAKTCKAIMNNEAMTTLFSCFAPTLFSGTMIARGISPLTDKLDQKIWSDKIAVVDDPRSQDALSLQNYDDEGTPTCKKDVVKDGVFKTILHNTSSALKMNTVSTGNGFVAGGGATSDSPMNMYIVPGKDDEEELEALIGDGVVITNLAGMHAGVDPVTTNFSLQARGYLVENGKRVRPLTLITIAGNFMQMMNDVEAVGNNLEWKFSSIACPSILFEKLAIGGQE